MVRRLANSLLLTLVPVSAATAAEPLSYSRDIRPILSAKCWHCHGPDPAAREADLRLDRQASAHARREGSPAIVPGKPSESELVRRITATDQNERMPPADEPRQLTAAEIKLLSRWIAEGGKFESHWAFRAPQAVSPPETESSWPRNAVDRFVLARLNAEGLAPAPEAGRHTLARRVTLGLTGLPPTIAEVEAFVDDDRPDAYERFVDRLLASPAYGERMSLFWLDAARFADSGGYQGDILRSMWMWRDWVIAAYNSGMPFDRFTTEQLAGDLLPNATVAQKIATGFHRNHRINDEDGIIFEEFRVEYVADRVETTGTVWLGLTIGCARCHDHKYDPISQRDYYRLFGHFNSIDESGRGHGNAPPLYREISPALQKQLDAVAKKLKAVTDDKSEDAAKQRKALAAERDKLLKSAPSTMIMRELETPRPTHILVRGAYDRPGEQVSPGTLSSIGPQEEPKANSTPNRLALAEWLLDERHPLTSRVTVNRLWQIHFGRGLVETTENFGTQGAPPTHPRLLDWLAREFIRSNWDVKAMHRLIVTSATYRQSSRGTKALNRRDPTNDLLARGPRFRLHAETIRDVVLASSGMLHRRIGGPSVMPAQPPGLWTELASANRKYVPGTGADLARRSMYTFIRRTVPPPDMAAIDAPNRELCTVRRPRTNTPTQALVVMNHPLHIEAAKALAADAIAIESDDAARIDHIFRRILSRPAAIREQALLRESLAHFRRRHADDSHAVWAAVASIVYNLHETITQE